MINVTAIKLPEVFDSYKNTEEEKAEFLEPVSKINIFVGSNNSGKSRFMREISKLNELEVKQNTIDLKDVISEITKAIDLLITTMTDNKIIQVGNRIELDFLKSCLITLNGLINLGNDRFDVMRKAFNELSNSSRDSLKITFDKITNENKAARFVQGFRTHFIDKAIVISNLFKEVSVLNNESLPAQIYIPTLRGLRPFDDNHTDFYMKRTSRDYFDDNTNNKFEIFTGLSLYQKITDLLLGNYSERLLIEEYQKFISNNLYEGKRVTLIPKQKEQVLFVKIGKEEEKPIYKLGDGIQSTIILSFLPFIMQEQTFFFIEEPEMFLHPGLQRKILKFYDSPECKNHTFFMTTHSNHFLDLTIDITNASIFTFRKIIDESKGHELNPDFTIEAVDSGCQSSLELLGVRNSSVFLVNATIWVEGITDRWYLRKMLESYMKYLSEQGELKMNLEEDTHYSFVEYGGANITHWSFLDKEEHPIEVERLCAKAMVIIDGDGDSKTERKEKLKERLKDNLIILPCREIENALPYDVIKQVVLENEKDENLKIKDFAFNDYKDEYLGDFIEEKMLKNNSDRQGAYRIKPQQGKKKTGTIKDKKGFCEKAKPKIKYVDLDKSIKEIVQKIYNFVCEQNSR